MERLVNDEDKIRCGRSSQKKHSTCMNTARTQAVLSFGLKVKETVVASKECLLDAERSSVEDFVITFF